MHGNVSEKCEPARLSSDLFVSPDGGSITLPGTLTPEIGDPSINNKYYLLHWLKAKRTIIFFVLFGLFISHCLGIQIMNAFVIIID